MGNIATHAMRSMANAMGIEFRRINGGKPWDQAFRSWIAEAEASGQDPNDVGDVDWAGDPANILAQHTAHLYDEDSVVLELGPGTGRATRYVLPRCKKMILLDYSEFVCSWLDRYLAGKGTFETHWIEHPRFASVADRSVDFAFAYGVFEHIDLDDTWEMFREIERVLRPGGHLWFNFDTLSTPGGLAHFKAERARLGPEQRSVFRFHHPDDLCALAQDAGLEVSALERSQDRSIWVTLHKD